MFFPKRRKAMKKMVRQKLCYVKTYEYRGPRDLSHGKRYSLNSTSTISSAPRGKPSRNLILEKKNTYERRIEFKFVKKRTL